MGRGKACDSTADGREVDIVPEYCIDKVGRRRLDVSEEERRRRPLRLIHLAWSGR